VVQEPVVQEPVVVGQVENQILLRDTLSQDPVGATMIMFLPQITADKCLGAIPSDNRVMDAGTV
jgi:hypothetical protein